MRPDRYGEPEKAIQDEVIDVPAKTAVRIAPDVVRSVWNEGPDDAELVIAQGSENLAREDLSYIERAHFARNMERAGIARDAKFRWAAALLPIDPATTTLADWKKLVLLGSELFRIGFYVVLPVMAARWMPSAVVPCWMSKSCRAM